MGDNLLETLHKLSATELRQCISNVEKLDLILPTPLLNGSTSDRNHTLKELREKAGEFRNAYLNWRQRGLRGARGETADVVGRGLSQILPSELTDHLQSKFIEPDEADSTILSKRMRSVQFDFSSILEAGENLTHVTAAVEPEPSTDWLRLYFNPFTPAVPAAELEPLSNKELAAMLINPNLVPGVVLPKYDRSLSVDNWILHLGVGGFHRSHQAVILDDVLNLCSDDGEYWGICGIGLTAADEKMHNALFSQDFLYTVLSRSTAVHEARVIGSIRDFILVTKHNDVTVSASMPTDENLKPHILNKLKGRVLPLWMFKLISPRSKIVSLTITEKGYCQNVDGNLDTNHPLIQHDLESLYPPQSAIGLILVGLAKRRSMKLPAFTVLSCDNLPNNGKICQRIVIGLAQLLESQFEQTSRLPKGLDTESEVVGLSTWISANVSFPCSMVDRITPITKPEHCQIVRDDFGIVDAWPVVAEDFKQWVVEDRFPLGRPKWESVGTLMVNDVRPFEEMKIRLLNGGHSILGYMAYLAGHRFVDDAINDLLISSMLRSYMDEVTSTIRGVSVELERYKEKIVERFGNKHIKDTLERICEDGSIKFFNSLKEPLIELLTEGRHIHNCAFGLCCWIFYLQGHDQQGNTVAIKDPKADELTPLADLACKSPWNLTVVANCLIRVFGLDLGSNVRLVNEVSLGLCALTTRSIGDILLAGGVLACLLQHCLDDKESYRSLLHLANVVVL